MKKISLFLAAVLTVFSIAAVPAVEADAYPDNSVWNAEVMNYRVGDSLFSQTTSGDVTDVTKAAICPAGQTDIDQAYCTFDVSESDKQNWSIYLTRTIPDSVPTGSFQVNYYKADNTYVTTGIGNKRIVTANIAELWRASLINNDGYVYMFTYASVGDLTPTLYDANKSVIAPNSVSKTTEQRSAGTATVYRFDLPNSYTADDYFYVSCSGFINRRTYCDENYGIALIDVFNTTSQSTTDTSSSSTSSSSSEATDTSTTTATTTTTAAVAPVVVPTATATVSGQLVPVTIGAMNSATGNTAVDNSAKTIFMMAGTIHTNQAGVVQMLSRYKPSAGITGISNSGTLELTVPEGTDVSKGVTITFSDATIASTVKRTDKIVVLHVKHNGEIEFIDCIAGDGSITATFTELSPIAWFAVSTTSGSSGLTSPKTGDGFISFLLESFGF